MQSVENVGDRDADMKLATRIQNRHQRRAEAHNPKAMRTVERETMLTIKATAERLGLSVATIRQWVLLRKIAYHKLGRATRISEREIPRLLNEGEVPARVRF
jgi:excisionase family DNA binding protein